MTTNSLGWEVQAYSRLLGWLPVTKPVADRTKAEQQLLELKERHAELRVYEALEKFNELTLG